MQSVWRWAGEPGRRKAAARRRSVAALLAVLVAILFTGLFTVLVAAAPPAAAHQPSDSYLVLDVAGETIDGRWAIALRDLDAALGLDADDDGRLTWGEVEVRLPAIEAYAFARLSIGDDQAPCRLRPGEALVERLAGGTYLVLPFAAGCPAGREPLAIGYRLFFDLDRQHRGLVQVQGGGSIASTVFSPDRPTWQLARDGGGSRWREVGVYIEEGVHHILLGFDHLLFLVTLLLPAVLQGARGGGWRPVDRPRAAVGEVLKLVTAFTLAHSLTLGLATFGWLTLAPRIVEPLIALSIVFTALNNLYPMVRRGLWLLAFGFGLVHGIGFAEALKDLGLPPGELLLALFGFNLGVELGQLALVALVLPVALAVRRQPLYQPLALRFGSLAIAAVASLWLVERATGVVFLV